MMIQFLKNLKLMNGGKKEDCELIIGEYYKKNQSIIRNFGSK